MVVVVGVPLLVAVKAPLHQPEHEPLVSVAQLEVVGAGQASEQVAAEAANSH